MNLFSENVCCRFVLFAPKCSVKIVVYKATQNLSQLVKYSLTSQKCSHCQVTSVDVFVNENQWPCHYIEKMKTCIFKINLEVYSLDWSFQTHNMLRQKSNECN